MHVSANASNTYRSVRSRALKHGHTRPYMMDALVKSTREFVRVSATLMTRDRLVSCFCCANNKVLMRVHHMDHGMSSTWALWKPMRQCLRCAQCMTVFWHDIDGIQFMRHGCSRRLYPMVFRKKDDSLRSQLPTQRCQPPQSKPITNTRLGKRRATFKAISPPCTSTMTSSSSDPLSLPFSLQHLAISCSLSFVPVAGIHQPQCGVYHDFHL